MPSMCCNTPYSKIDCHSHFVPPEYTKALEEHGHKHPDGMPAIPKWSEESHLEMMSTVNVTKSILSITSPGTHLIPGDDALARSLTRYCNDYAADLKRRRPNQFGFFASLPIPDVEGSLAEIARVCDTQDPDGFTLLTNHHGVYLGDEKLFPVFDELNRRHATLFIHPTTPCMASHDGHNATAACPITRLPRPMFEFLFDTARTLIDLFLSGTVTRCPNITFIIPHMGGGFPPLLRRFSTIPSLLGLPGCDPLVNPEYVKDRLNKQFYFDTAGWPFPEQIHGLTEWVTADRMLYGSDFPWTPLQGVVTLSEDHDRYLAAIFPDRLEQEKLCWRNANRLLEATKRRKVVERVLREGPGRLALTRTQSLNLPARKRLGDHVLLGGKVSAVRGAPAALAAALPLPSSPLGLNLNVSVNVLQGSCC